MPRLVQKEVLGRYFRQTKPQKDRQTEKETRVTPLVGQSKGVMMADVPWLLPRAVESQQQGNPDPLVEWLAAWTQTSAAGADGT